MERIKQLTLEYNLGNAYGRRTDVKLPTVRGDLLLTVEETNDHSKLKFKITQLVFIFIFNNTPLIT